MATKITDDLTATIAHDARKARSVPTISCDARESQRLFEAEMAFMFRDDLSALAERTTKLAEAVQGCGGTPTASDADDGSDESGATADRIGSAVVLNINAVRADTLRAPR